MYCLHCEQEFESGMFCPICERMLIGENTFVNSEQNRINQTKWAEDSQEQDRKKREIEQKMKRKAEQASHIPKCPICGSTDLNKLTVVGRTASFGLFGFASNKLGKTYQCNNCKSTF